MICLTREVKPHDRTTDGSQEILFTGEWEILEAFNMTVIAKTNLSRDFADRIVAALNKEDNTDHIDVPIDIAQLSLLIKHYLRDWISANINSIRQTGSLDYESAVYSTIGKILIKNPPISATLIDSLIRLERKVWEDAKLMDMYPLNCMTY